MPLVVRIDRRCSVEVLNAAGGIGLVGDDMRTIISAKLLRMLSGKFNFCKSDGIVSTGRIYVIEEAWRRVLRDAQGMDGIIAKYYFIDRHVSTRALTEQVRVPAIRH